LKSSVGHSPRRELVENNHAETPAAGTYIQYNTYHDGVVMSVQSLSGT
jgi:hypothetical protein